MVTHLGTFYSYASNWPFLHDSVKTRMLRLIACKSWIANLALSPSLFIRSQASTIVDQLIRVRAFGLDPFYYNPLRARHSDGCLQETISAAVARWVHRAATGEAVVGVEVPLAEADPPPVLMGALDCYSKSLKCQSGKMDQTLGPRTFKVHLDVETSQGSGVWDRNFQITNLELMRSDR